MSHNSTIQEPLPTYLYQYHPAYIIFVGVLSVVGVLGNLGLGAALTAFNEDQEDLALNAFQVCYQL